MLGKGQIIPLMAVLLLLLAACTMPVEPTPVPPFETPERPSEQLSGRGQDALIDGVALVGDADTGFSVEIQGHLRDGCTAIERVTQAVEGDRIVVSVFTVRDPGAICTQALVPFTHTVPLDVTGLKPGEYVVDVQGATATLTVPARSDAPDAPVSVGQDALIDAVRVVSEAPYRLEIEGHLRDGCTELDAVSQTVEEGRITITVHTARPQDAICTQALVPFTHTIPLDVAGLEPGDYVVDVQGVTTTLTLSTEGAAPSEPGRAAIRQGTVAVREGVVEQIQVLILESYPVQINVQIEGTFPDGCTRLSEVVQLVQDDTIQLIVYTQRPREAMCTMAVVPFTETVRLDTSALAPGEYTIQVHGLTETLVLEEGMLGESNGEPVCPDAQEGQRRLIHATDGYCLVFPEIYSARSLAPGALVITAMERSDLPEARIVTLLIEQMGPIEGRDLEALAEEEWGRLARQGARLTRREARFGDLAVMVADGVPGRMAGRQALVADGGVYYLLTLTPIDRAYARQTAYAEELWEDVVASWRFFH